MLHERLVDRTLGVLRDPSQSTLAHAQFFKTCLVQKDPITKKFELCALQVTREVQQRHMKDLFQLLLVLILRSALLAVSLFYVLAYFLGTISLLLLQKRIVLFDHLLLEGIWNLSSLTHEESGCLLLHHLVEAKLVNVYEAATCLKAVFHSAKSFFHNNGLNFRLNINVGKAPPLLEFPVIDVRIVMATLCCAVMDQNGMQVIGHVAVVSESIRNAALELRYL